jgi:hypothetical protein
MPSYFCCYEKEVGGNTYLGKTKLQQNLYFGCGMVNLKRWNHPVTKVRKTIRSCLCQQKVITYTKNIPPNGSRMLCPNIMYNVLLTLFSLDILFCCELIINHYNGLQLCLMCIKGGEVGLQCHRISFFELSIMLVTNIPMWCIKHEFRFCLRKIRILDVVHVKL